VAPVILTYSASGLLAPGHPCLVAAPPHVPEVGALWDEADVVVAVGSDFDGMMTQGWKMPQPPHLVAINVDPRDASKNYRPDVVVEADAAAGAQALAERLGERGGLDSLERRLRELGRGVRERLGAEDPDAVAFLDAIEGALPDDAILVCDMCIPGYWLGGFHRTPAPRKLSYPLGWGTLGCAFPQGLGAALAGAGPAVSISGDGGFLYACGELAAAKQENIPLTVVIVDDGGYGMIRYDQDLHGDPREGVDLTNPDFVALAASFGIRADSVDGLGEHFAVALKGHVALREPTMLVARAALGPPPNVSPNWYRK
jgi:acetolactate synthase-1/2/3 large subunit